MKLLTKREIDLNKSDERRRQIEEGKRIAGRVDRLRELCSEEESSLERFRTVTIKAIHDEITKVAEERDLLRAETAALRLERTDLHRLIENEWEEIGEAQPEIYRIKKGLDEREQSISGSEQSIRAREEMVQAQEQQAQDLIREAEQIQAIARRDQKEAETLQNKAHLIHDGAVLFRERIESDLNEREAEISSREREYEKNESSVRERERALDAGWRLLNDRKAMFERTIKRI